MLNTLNDEEKIVADAIVLYRKTVRMDEASKQNSLKGNGNKNNTFQNQKVTAEFSLKHID